MTSAPKSSSNKRSSNSAPESSLKGMLKSALRSRQGGLAEELTKKRAETKLIEERATELPESALRERSLAKHSSTER